ncbi:MAG: diguanylate cyclase domain-containing protein [Spirochaetales bacterium]
MEKPSHETALELSRFEEAALTAWKRMVYQVALAAGTLILILSWFMRAPGDSFVCLAYPVFAVFFIGHLLLVRCSCVPLAKLEIGIFSSVSVLVLARLAWHFFVLGAVEERLLVLAGAHYWSVAILIVAGFVMFDRRVGINAGGAVLVFSALVALFGLSVHPPGDGFGGETVRHLLRVHLFLIVIFVLASAGAVLREHYSRAIVRSELLEEWANVDALTGIANRRAADRQLTQAVANAVRHDRSLSIIITDIDRFKRVNDEFGHTFGDTVLKAVAVRLGSLIRQSDFIARWGGEEFLIIAPESNGCEAANLAERCRTGIADTPIADTSITMTFGVGELRTDDTVDSLLVRADANLYEGKQTGRNKVVADCRIDERPA